MELVILGLVKILDNIFSTARNITSYQGKKIATSLLVIVNQILFYYVISGVVKGNSDLTMIIASVCSGIGTFIAMFINERLGKDITYLNILTCSCSDSVTALYNYLKSHGVRLIVADSYGLNNEKTKTVMAFARSRFESKLIDDFLQNSETKFFREVLH